MYHAVTVAATCMHALAQYILGSRSECERSLGVSYKTKKKINKNKCRKKTNICRHSSLYRAVLETRCRDDMLLGPDKTPLVNAPEKKKKKVRYFA